MTCKKITWNVAAIGVTLALMGPSSQAGVRVAVSDVFATSIVKAVSTSGFCPNNDIELYKIGPSTDSIGNVFSVRCKTGNFAGTAENEINFDASGGSMGAFLQSSHATSEPTATDGSFISSSATGCSSLTGTGEFSFIGEGRLKACPANTPLSSGKVVGGFMEMPTPLYAFQGLLNTQKATEAFGYMSSLTATYGVAVSRSLYEALQQDQGKVVGIFNSTPENQPSISKASISSLIAGYWADPKLKGLRFLAPSKPVEQIIYCKLPDKSGVQAFANAYFLNAGPGSDGLMYGAMVSMGPNQVGQEDEEYPMVTGRMNASIGALKNCLNGPGHRIAFMPGNQNPVKNGETFRFVKLNRVELSEGTASSTNTLTARSGEYDFTSDITIFNPDSNSFIDAIGSRLHFGGGPGVYVNGSSPDSGMMQSRFSRGGNPAQSFIWYE